MLSPLILGLPLASPALPRMANGRSSREPTTVAEQDQDQTQSETTEGVRDSRSLQPGSQEQRQAVMASDLDLHLPVVPLVKHTIERSSGRGGCRREERLTLGRANGTPLPPSPMSVL